eukprot:scaffold1166_cov261-Pinguiococcus_pyrenoidosus.AAC.32
MFSIVLTALTHPSEAYLCRATWNAIAFQKYPRYTTTRLYTLRTPTPLPRASSPASPLPPFRLREVQQVQLQPRVLGRRRERHPPSAQQSCPCRAGSLVCSHDSTHDQHDAEGDESEEALLVVVAIDQQGGNGEGDDGDELQKHIQGRSRGVLERITDRVANNDRLVRLGTLQRERGVSASAGPRARHPDRQHSNACAHLSAVGLLNLNVLLGIVPRATSVRHHDRELGAGDDGSAEDTQEAAGSDDEADDKRNHDRDDTGQDHLLNGALGGDRHTLLVIRLLRAVHDAGALTELLAHDQNDGSGRLLHGEHGEGREEKRQHPPEKCTGHDDRVRQAAVGLGLLGERVEEADRREHGAADGEALAGRRRRVSERVQSISGVAHALRQFRHLRNAAGIVGNGAVSVGREGDAEGAEHAHGCDGDSVAVREGIAGEDDHDEGDDRRRDGEHANAQALNDHGGRSRDAGVGNRLGGREGVGREVLGHLSDEDSRDDAHAVAAPDAESIVDSVGHEGADDAQRRQDREEGSHVRTTMQRVQQLVLGGVLLRGHEEEANHRGDHARGRDEERNGHKHLVRGEGGRRDDGAHKGLEEVGAHSGDVPHVVTDVVGDGGRVARIVLWDALLHLSHEVCAHVGGLGVDPTGHTGEKGDGARAEAEAGKRLDRELLVDEEDAVGTVVEITALSHDEIEGSQAHEGEADDGEAHHRAAREGNLERRVQAVGDIGRPGGAGGVSCRGGSDVRGGGHGHSHPASQSGEAGANDEAAQRAESIQAFLVFVGVQVEVIGGGAGTGDDVLVLDVDISELIGVRLDAEDDAQEDGDRDHEEREVVVLGAQERLGSVLDLQRPRARQGFGEDAAPLRNALPESPSPAQRSCSWWRCHADAS